MNQSSQPANDAPVTLINVFEMPTEHAEAFIAGWRERAALMSSKPGCDQHNFASRSTSQNSEALH